MRLLILLCLFSQFEAKATECIETFLQGYSVDSAAYELYDDDVSELFDSKPSTAAKKAVSKLVESLNCSADASTKIKEVTCKEMIPGKFYSLNCYVEAKNGYFFVSKDMMEKVNIIFNRFD